MPETQSQAGLSRRALFKYGLLGALGIAAAGAGVSSIGFFQESALAPGLKVLRERDLHFLRALIPALLEGAVSAKDMPQTVEKTVRGMDYSLYHLSPEMLALTGQLLVTLSLPVARAPLSGIWGRWENASAADMRAFLKRWQESPLALLKMGHNSLLQLVAMGWYGNPDAFAQCGYPGPPNI